MGNSFGGTKRPISLPPVARPVTGDGGLTDDDPADLEETEVSQRLSSVRGGVCVCVWEGGGGGSLRCCFCVLWQDCPVLPGLT